MTSDGDPTNSIPVLRSPPDTMSVGVNGGNLASAAVREHPVDRMQRAAARSNTGQMDLDAIRRIYGTGLAMRLTTERRMASQVGGRLMGMHGGGSFMESRAMLESLTGDDMTIDFGDVLNRPCDDPNQAVVGVRGGEPHDWMEKKMNL